MSENVFISNLLDVVSVFFLPSLSTNVLNVWSFQFALTSHIFFFAKKSFMHVSVQNYPKLCLFQLSMTSHMFFCEEVLHAYKCSKLSKMGSFQFALTSQQASHFHTDIGDDFLTLWSMITELQHGIAWKHKKRQTLGFVFYYINFRVLLV